MRILLLAFILLAGCSSVDLYTTGSAVMLDETASYEPTTTVELLESPPTRPYERIAIVEAKGTQAVGLPEILERLRVEGKKIGAHAILPPESGTEQTPQGIIYNPYLGGYQTMGGVQTTILRGTAIRYTD